jgi:cytochrome bd ubiquinol oxidase subunit II
MAFAATGAAIVLTVAAVWTQMFPMVIPASSGAVVAGVPGVAISLAASQPYTLTVMTIVAVIFTPIVLLYQGWTYWVFRKRLESPAASPQPAPSGL